MSGIFKLDSGNVPIYSLTEPSSLDVYDLNGPQNSLDLLSVAPNLDTFHLYIDNYAVYKSPPSNKTTPVVLPRLRVLTVSSLVSDIVIDRVTLPSLEALCSTGSYFRRRVDSEIYRNLFHRSSPPLTQLELGNENAEAFIPILRLLPTIKRLKISNTWISEYFFRSLTVDVSALDDAAESRTICPSLVFLELEDLVPLGTRDTQEEHANALLTMVKSRMRVLGTFKVAELGSSINRHDEEMRIIDVVDVDMGRNVENVRHAMCYGRVIIHGDSYPDPIEFY